MVGGWYGAPSKQRIEKFYDYTYEWSSTNASDWERLSIFMESDLTKDHVPFSSIKIKPKKKFKGGYVKKLMDRKIFSWWEWFNK